MKWSKPSVEDKRFGFEITMYVYIAAEKNLKALKKVGVSKTSQLNNPVKEKEHHESD